MSRAQYVLDLSRPEVVDYAYECVASILAQRRYFLCEMGYEPSA